jgi:Xaa-Pro aminopeptidase
LSFVQQHQGELKTPMGREAAADALKRAGFPRHGLAVDMAEGAPKAFQAGNVICYEPLFSAAGQGFFVEDTFVITGTGHEVLNPQLPYAPKDIEAAMRHK